MAEKNYKVGEAIEIVYQAPGAVSGLTVTCEIILPGNIKDSSFPDSTLNEVLGKGVYQKEFTPNAPGEWKTIVHIPAGGQVVKRYSVGAHNVESVGNAVGSVGSAINDLDNDISSLDGDVGVVDEKVEDVQTTVDNIETKVDDINVVLGGFDSPPMIS